jgi:hypothetical protein
MKIGIILFILGLVLLTLLLKTNITKTVIKNIAFAIAILLSIYGLILMVQPNEDKYFDYTQTTISQPIKAPNEN